MHILSNLTEHEDQTMATRRPLLLTLIRLPEGEPMRAVFQDGERMTSMEEVKERIVAENEVTGGDVSSVPIQLTLYSDQVFDTIVIDLPGFIVTPERTQAQDLPDQIMRLNIPYMVDPMNILAVVSPAPTDPAVSLAGVQGLLGGSL